MSETKEEPQENVNGDNGTSLEMLIVEAVNYFKRGRDWIRMSYLRWQNVADLVAEYIDERKLVLGLPSAEDCRFRYKKYTKGTKKKEGTKEKEKQAVFRQLTVKKKTLVNNYTLDDTLFDDFDNPISEKYILEMLTTYWPNGKINLTPKIVDALYKKIMRCIPTEEKLKEQIKTAWSQKEKFMSEKMLEDLKNKRPLKKSNKPKTTRLYGSTLEERIQNVKDHVAKETKKVISRGTPMSEPQIFINFNLNQGDIGICYMVAVIILFQNEFSILDKLKSLVNGEMNKGNKVDKTITQLLYFLDNNYSTIKSAQWQNNLCQKKFLPKLPESWQKTVHQTDGATKTKDIVSGGDPAFLLTFIFVTLDAWHDSFNVYFNYEYIKDDDIRMTKTGKGKRVEYNDTKTMTIHTFAIMVETFQRDDKKNIALIELHFGDIAQKQLTVGDDNPFEMVDTMARLPTVRGFIVRVSKGTGGHVVAGTVDNVSGKVPQEVFYCNSWGKGCGNSDAINTELSGVESDYKITDIHFVLRKQNFDFDKFYTRNTIDFFSSDDEEDEDE